MLLCEGVYRVSLWRSRLTRGSSLRIRARNRKKTMAKPSSDPYNVTDKLDRIERAQSSIKVAARGGHYIRILFNLLRQREVCARIRDKILIICRRNRMIALVVLILLPICYIAKSKGYNVTAACVVSGLVAWLGPIIVHFFRSSEPMLPVVDITVPLLVLVVVWFLPARKDAPGKAYLKISFKCSECNQTITFGRELEGCPELCPKCGEIVTVPSDQFSPKVFTKSKPRPQVLAGEVCFENFARQEDAILLQAMFESDGIASRVVSNDGGGVMGQLSAWHDFKVIINVKDWDKAVKIQDGGKSTATLPRDPRGSLGG